MAEGTIITGTHLSSTLINELYRLTDKPDQGLNFIEHLIDSISSLNAFELDHLRKTLDIHFENAWEISKRYSDLAKTDVVLANYLNAFSFPISVVGKRLSVVACNSTMSLLLKEHRIEVDRGKLVSSHEKTKAKLKLLEDTIFESQDADNKYCCVIDSSSRDAPLIIIALPFSGSELFDEPLAILLALQRKHHEYSLPTSQTDLSDAESEIIRLLTTGLSRTEIAEVRSVSENTIRRQLNTVFKKLNVGSRTELLKDIQIAETLRISHGDVIKPTRIADYKTRILKLKDGRDMAYCLYGSTNPKQTILYCHCNLGSRFQITAPEEELVKRGIQVIIPDRPGIGYSTPKKDRSLHEWYLDVLELLDDRKVEQFSLLGCNGGSYYSLSVAHQLRSRVRKLGLVNPFNIYEFADDVVALPFKYRIFSPLYKLGSYALLFLLNQLIRLNPVKLIMQDLEKLPDFIETFNSTPDLVNMTERCLVETFRQDAHALQTEVLCYLEHWRTRLREVNMPVHIWLGTAVNAGLEQRTINHHRKLPNVDFTIDRSKSGLILYSEWQAMFDWFACD